MNDTNLQRYAKKRMAETQRIRALEERVAQLEGEVRTLTSMMRGTAPTVPITPWKLPYIYEPIECDSLPIIKGNGPVQDAGTFREDHL